MRPRSPSNACAIATMAGRKPSVPSAPRNVAKAKPAVRAGRGSRAGLDSGERAATDIVPSVLDRADILGQDLDQAAREGIERFHAFLESVACDDQDGRLAFDRL